MASTTGIELGPDSCVLVGVRPGRGTTDLFAVHAIEPAAWPAHDEALATALRQARRKQRLPRAAHVVAWGLPQSASPDDPMTRAALRPLLAAGFTIESVLHPPEALAALAARRPRPGDGGPVAWLALNTHGAAIAIVRENELLFSRTFDWRYEHGIASPKAQMLQRYSLVSHLAPELRRGMEMVRAAHGMKVETAVTCGDLPDLRSLTMPLIEELDLEVETLDSTEGLRLTGRAKGERLADSAPALRLACAAALAPLRKRKAALMPLLRAAAALVVVGGLGWLAYGYWSSTGVRPAGTAVAVRQPPPQTQQAQARTPQAPPRTQPPPKSVTALPPPAAAIDPPGTAPPATVAPVSAPSVPVTSVPVKSAPVKSAPEKSVPPVSQTRPAPQTRIVTTPPPAAPIRQPNTAVPQPKPVPTTSPPVQQARSAPAAAQAVAPPKFSPSTPKPSPARNVELAPIIPAPPSRKVAEPAAAKVTAPPPQEPRAATPPRRLVPLTDPLPRVDSILIDRDRRLAVINGEIVAVGDAVGPRVVLQIDREAVVFREPSGFDVRVPLRARSALYIP